MLKVKKLGGENVAELGKSSSNIAKDFENKQVQSVIVSAIRSPEFNTTDKLIEVGKELGENKPNKKAVIETLNKILDFHLKIINEKVGENSENIKVIAETKFNELKEVITEWIERKDKKKLLPRKENDYSIKTKDGKWISIIGFGEVISNIIFSEVINSLDIELLKARSIDLSNIVESKEIKSLSEEDIFTLLTRKISDKVEQIISDGEIAILPGYIGNLPKGIENTIGRGYSDATASILSIGLSNKGYEVVLEVQKSVKGLLSADPKILDKPEDAKLIEETDYITAREITGARGAQAKLLHPQALRDEVQQAGINIHLLGPFQEGKGTWIKNEKSEKSDGVEFIGARKDIIFFSISSGNMFKKGFLANLFDIVKEYASVDIVSTSETEITFTLDEEDLNQEQLKEITKKIREEFKLYDDNHMEFVRYKNDKSLVFCIGQNMRHKIGVLAKAATALADEGINVEIVSQGRLKRAIVFGIEGNDMKKAVNVLHKKFIGNN